MLSQAVFVASAETETALETGDRNVLFSNNYRGFCLDSAKKGAYTGDSFVPADASNAQSNKDNSNISQLLKALFTQCFEDIFESDGNGNYIVKDTNTVQAVVWHLTDGYYIWGEQKTLLNKAMEYSGDEIPDNGYTITLSSGEVVTFYFMIMLSQDESKQDFFAYRLEVSESATSEEPSIDEPSSEAPVVSEPETSEPASSEAPVVPDDAQFELDVKVPANAQADEIIDVVAEIRWVLAHATPWLRGSDAISNAFMRALFKAVGIKAYPPAKGISYDLEAYCRNLDDYKANFNSFFEKPLEVIE